jgi:hypothetical protein
MESREECSPSPPLFTSTPLETAGSVEKLLDSLIFSSKPLPTPSVSVESDDDVQIVDWPTVEIIRSDSREECNPSRTLFTMTPLKPFLSAEKDHGSPLFSSKPPVSVESDDGVQILVVESEKAPSTAIQISSDSSEDNLSDLSCRPYKSKRF